MHTDTSSDLCTQMLHAAKETLWRNYSHISEEQRHKLWSERKPQLMKLMGTDVSAGYLRSSHVPRSTSFGGYPNTLQTSV